MSQYPRWWAGSSDWIIQNYQVQPSVSQYPRWWAGSSDQKAAKDNQKECWSQYPRWWAGSSDLMVQWESGTSSKVSIPSLVGRLLGLRQLGVFVE